MAGEGPGQYLAEYQSPGLPAMWHVVSPLQAELLRLMALTLTALTGSANFLEQEEAYYIHGGLIKMHMHYIDTHRISPTTIVLSHWMCSVQPEKRIVCFFPPIDLTKSLISTRPFPRAAAHPTVHRI